jgi:phosphonate transport system substrate-binding protein
MIPDKRLFIVIVFLFVAVDLRLGDPLAAQDRLLMFGRVHDDPVRSIRDRQEFIDYIAKKLAPLGIAGGRIVVVERLGLLARALKAGQVDLFHDSVVPTMVLSKWTGSVPVLRQWKNGEAEYEGLIVVRRDSGINTLADLKGRTIAFEEPHSTSATILPRMLLEERNLKLVEIKSPGKPKADTVGFVYGSDGNSANFLITGRTDAATITSRELERFKPEIGESLKVIGKTRTVPRQIIAVRKDLDPKIVTSLKKVLTGMDRDPEGRTVLKRQQNTTKIDAITPASLQQLKQIERFVFSSLGDQVESW